MIQKLISIKNVGHFIDYSFQGSQEWNGLFHKVNVIYAPNGSGKTTLSTIFKSIKNNQANLISFKKTFGTTELPEIKFKTSLNTDLLVYKDSTWNYSIPEMEVFDINFIEDYLFMGSIAKSQNKNNLFKLILGNEGLVHKTKCKELIHKKERALAIFNKPNTKTDIESLEIRERKYLEAKENLDKALADYNAYSNAIFARYITAVNYYLSKFTTYINLANISFQENTTEFERFRIIMTFKVYGETVQFLAPDPNRRIANAKYALSEGDKSTIALCVFLARFQLENISNKIIVFDDPLSSFDYNRRSATISQLSIIANSSSQFFLLTHDLHFANDFYDKNMYLDNISLKIGTSVNGSNLQAYNIKKEYLNNTQKNMWVLKGFLAGDYTTDEQYRNVIRCIRPSLEGLLKTKYFDEIEPDIWLGDIVEKIRNADTSKRIARLKPLIADLISLNDYTKSYHHDSGCESQDPVNPAELLTFITQSFKVFNEI